MISLIGLMMVAACLPVHDSVLHGRDLAAADPRFASMDPDSTLGYAPVPGTRRVISEAEMARLAKRFAVEASPREVCFEYAMQNLDTAALLKAMQEALPAAKVEIVETSKFTVPEGNPIFSANLLPKPPVSRPDDPVIWRGYIEYAPNRRFTVWAKVKVVAKDVEVMRGDEVAVHVEAGGAVLKLYARAQSQASVGETVKLRNPKSGKLFEARVTGKGMADLEAR